jgi:uncharacterized protein (TIGR02217 family)
VSTAVFPTLAGLSFGVVRTPSWNTYIQEAVSGKETRVARSNAPRRKYEMNYDLLRSTVTNAELQALEGFFNLRQGMFDSFLFNDVDDNSVIGQNIGIGDGVTISFQLVRSFGGFSDIVTAPHVISTVYINGTPQSGATWSVTTWGTTNPGVLTFTSAPAGGGVITVDMTYYWPVRFTTDDINFSKFMTAMWEAQKVGFITIV